MTTPAPSTIGAAIDAAHEARQELPRPHLGASIIGHKCDRYIWLSFRWAVVEQFSGRILRLFRRGHMEEATVHEDLRLAGCKVQTIDPATRKQFRFDDGHFGGSCDGIITHGVPEAVKVPHLLEVKTHSTKSFKEVQERGVHISKPQHWAQMQVYMAAFDLEWALYYAVNKDTDEIYTERVQIAPPEPMKLFAKAQRLIASDRAPNPISTDPTWFECRYCAAHDQCHGSKLTKQVNCRTCLHSTAERDGRWTCAHWGVDIPDVDAQRAGCDEHLLHPDLVPPDWKMDPSPEHGVIWLTPHGKIKQPDYTSAEVVANPAGCASGVRDEWAHFGGKVVG